MPRTVLPFDVNPTSAKELQYIKSTGWAFSEGQPSNNASGIKADIDEAGSLPAALPLHPRLQTPRPLGQFDGFKGALGRTRPHGQFVSDLIQLYVCIGRLLRFREPRGSPRAPS